MPDFIINGSSKSHSLFGLNDKQTENNQKYDNEWDRQHAARYGANAPVWTVAAGGGHVQ